MEIISFVEGKIRKEIYIYICIFYLTNFPFYIFSDDFRVYIWKVPDIETMINERSFTKNLDDLDDEICELLNIYRCDI